MSGHRSNLLAMLTVLQNGPYAGALAAESSNKKKKIGHELSVSLWICTIFCMREAVTIPDGRMLTSPP